MNLQIGNTILHYRLLEQIGQGGIPTDRRQIGIPQARKEAAYVGEQILYSAEGGA